MGGTARAAVANLEDAFAATRTDLRRSVRSARGGLPDLEDRHLDDAGDPVVAECGRFRGEFGGTRMMDRPGRYLAEAFHGFQRAAVRPSDLWCPLGIRSRYRPSGPGFGTVIES